MASSPIISWQIETQNLLLDPCNSLHSIQLPPRTSLLMASRAPGVGGPPQDRPSSLLCGRSEDVELL